MSERKGYQCQICERSEIVYNKTIPKCCRKPMKQVPLEMCTKPHDPEHARPMEDEDACDDFRGGK